MKVLLLTSSTGGGHDMRADAFEAWAKSPLTTQYNVQTARLQTLETTHRLYRFGVELYNTIQKKAPWLHHFYFSTLEQMAMHERADQLLGKETFTAALETLRPDCLLSTHAHLNHGFFELARQVLGRKNIRCATYCGELFGGYGFSRFWVNPHADMFIGAVSETCREADWLGMPSKRNRVGGFLLKPQFYTPALTPAERATFVRETLRLDPERFILVLATGANGANNHQACLEALERAHVYPQVVALCGRNEQAKSQLETWSHKHQRIPLCVLSYTDAIHLLMDAASCIFARPGTGTTSEALLRRCPIIFNGLGGVMPQEAITLKFARKHRFGALVSHLNQFPSQVENLMNQQSLAQQRSAMAQARPSQSPDLIFRMLAELW